MVKPQITFITLENTAAYGFKTLTTIKAEQPTADQFVKSTFDQSNETPAQRGFDQYGTGLQTMSVTPNTDYATYREIMDELLRPISGDGLDADTLKRLYESKLVYLENLRIKCFKSINNVPAPNKPTNHFTQADYSLIVKAISDTRGHLRHSMLLAISGNLSRRKAI